MADTTIQLISLKGETVTVVAGQSYPLDDFFQPYNYTISGDFGDDRYFETIGFLQDLPGSGIQFKNLGCASLDGFGFNIGDDVLGSDVVGRSGLRHAGRLLVPPASNGNGCQ
jgi:hypothetical protein